jgi:predicted peroxiredoxin
MKVLYFCTTGAGDPTRASLPLHMAANGSVETGQECAVVLAGDGAELASKETVDGIQGIGLPAAGELMAKLAEHEVPVYI